MQPEHPSSVDEAGGLHPTASGGSQLSPSRIQSLRRRLLCSRGTSRPRAGGELPLSLHTLRFGAVMDPGLEQLKSQRSLGVEKVSA